MQGTGSRMRATGFRMRGTGFRIRGTGLRMRGSTAHIARIVMSDALHAGVLDRADLAVEDAPVADLGERSCLRRHGSSIARDSIK